MRDGRASRTAGKNLSHYSHDEADVTRSGHWLSESLVSTFSLPGQRQSSSRDGHALVGSSLGLHLLTLERGWWMLGFASAVTSWCSCFKQSRKKELPFQCGHLYLPCCIPTRSSTRDSALVWQVNFCWFLRQPSPAHPFGHISGGRKK